jgi:hypothetical protein
MSSESRTGFLYVLQREEVGDRVKPLPLTRTVSLAMLTTVLQY